MTRSGAYGGGIIFAALLWLSCTLPALAATPTEVAADTANVEGGDTLPPPAPEEKRVDSSRTDIGLFNKTISRKDKVKSIFYTQEEIDDIHLAINTYLKYIGRGGDLTLDESVFLGRLESLKKSSNTQSRFFTYPQFYLDSLVYHTPNDWLVWINGEKMTQNTPRESTNIHVVSIDQDKVEVEWFPLAMERVIETWEKFPNKDVVVNKTHNQVVFTLKPNQTFSSYVMQVLEGKVLPVTVDVTQLDTNIDFSMEDDEEEGATQIPKIGAASGIDTPNNQSPAFTSEPSEE